eukprot:2903336-Pleurochrysis_carterae.AAC.1
MDKIASECVQGKGKRRMGAKRSSTALMRGGADRGKAGLRTSKNRYHGKCKIASTAVAKPALYMAVVVIVMIDMVDAMISGWLLRKRRGIHMS